MEILWLDDDTASETVTIDGVRITKVQNCQQADDRLKVSLPDWLLVDFIVPQKSWGDGVVYRVPGLKFIESVHTRYKGEVRLAAYGRGVVPSWRAVAQERGAEEVFEKRQTAFTDVIRKLKALKEVR